MFDRSCLVGKGRLIDAHSTFEFLDRGVTELAAAKAPSKARMRPWRTPTTSVQPRPRWHNLLVADMNIDENAVLRLRICGHAPCRIYNLCAWGPWPALLAVRNAVPKCGVSSDMRLTIATSKANRAGNPIAAVRSAIGSGCSDLREGSRCGGDPLGRRVPSRRPRASARFAVDTASG